MSTVHDDHDVSHPLNLAIENGKKMDPSIQTPTPKGGRGKLTLVEPLIFISVISGFLFDIVGTNIIEAQYCKSVLNIHELSSCLNHTAPHFSRMQKYASNFFMLQMLIFTFFTVGVSIFLGPWSDTFGRRPLILAGSVGATLTYFMWTVAIYTNVHPSYFLLLDVPMVLSGGSSAVQMAAMCYICDITTTEARVFRMGLLIGLSYCGALTASLVTPHLQIIGYSFILMLATSLSAVTLLFALIFLKESVTSTEDQRKLVSKNPFQWSHVRSIYETCYSKQPPAIFQILMYIILLNIVSSTQIVGEQSVFYLFLQKAFGWTLADYTQLFAITTITQALAAFTSTSKFLNFTDLSIIKLSIAIRLLSALVFFFGTQNWLVYITAPLSNISRINAAVIRSFLSKILDANDIGKVFALCGLFDLLSSFLGSPIYTTIYKETMDTCPKAIFLVSAFMAFMIALLCMKIHFLHQNLRASKRVQ